MKRTSTKWMFTACGLISAAGVFAFAYLMALAHEVILAWSELLAPFAAGIYCYCAGAAIPCIAAVALLGMVIREIGRERAFTMKNARLVQGISWMAFTECIYIAAGIVGWSMARIMHPGVILIALAVIMLGAGVGILAWALASLVRRASAIQQENDLTV